jgi:soluble lytic murein transglycosylase-like protein
MDHKHLFLSFCLFVILVKFSIDNEEVQEVLKIEGLPSTSVNESSPPCLKMYDAINKWATTYNIPLKYAFGIAFKETTYRGPFDWKYKHNQTSCVGAIGPMQIMPSTADFTWRTKISRDRLMNDIDFNVHTSMKLLRTLYNKYGDWKIAFGCYNTGYPKINQYAIDVYNHVPKWNMSSNIK